MSRQVAGLLALMGALLAAPAFADVLLDGHQHIGNDDTTSDATAQFVPVDPVTKQQIQSYPSYFHLSQGLTVTGIRLHNPIGLDGQIKLQIDGVERALNVCAACNTCNGRQVCAASISMTLTVPVALAAGVHTLAVYADSASNDFGFSAATLLSTGTSTSRNLNQRRNVGDDNDANDDYDITDPGSPWYPDASAGLTASIPFTLDDNRRLVRIDFRRLRDLDTNDAQVRVDGQLIGNLPNTGDPLEADPTTLTTGLLLATGAHTLTVVAGTIGPGNRDTMSWDDILLIFTDLTSTGTAGFFNAVNAGQDALTGQITTKVAGGSATLDLYALNGFGTAVETGYNGTANVALLDASNNTGVLDIYGCRSSWTVAQSFGAVTFVGGKATISPVFPDAGLREARVRITDTSNSASGCSLDNFAVRPHSFGSIVISHDSETTAGVTESLANTGTTGLPRHKAGRPFTIRATAVAANGNAATAYTGTPVLAATALAPATVDGATVVTTWTALGGGALRTDTAQYLEAGPVRFALSDPDYAAVDADDSTVAERTIGPGTVDAGRFIPDRFTLADEGAAPAFLAACGTFTYVGQPFDLDPAPYRARITAVAANGAVTRNYTSGGLYKLPASLPATTLLAQTGTVSAVNAPVPDNAMTNQGNGVTRFELLPTRFAFARGAPVPPFDAEVAFELGALGEADGVAIDPQPARIGQPAAGQGIAFTGGKQQRFGRLAIDNAHGSELAPLSVPVRAEYWSGASGGFERNTADNCTPLALGDIGLSGSVAGPPDPPADTVPALGPLSNGLWTLSLSAPGAPGFADITASLAATLSWLQTDDADADADYDDDPVARATFGLSNDRDRRIYQREVVGF